MYCVWEDEAHTKSAAAPCQKCGEQEKQGSPPQADCPLPLQRAVNRLVQRNGLVEKNPEFEIAIAEISLGFQRQRHDALIKRTLAVVEHFQQALGLLHA